MRFLSVTLLGFFPKSSQIAQDQRLNTTKSNHSVWISCPRGDFVQHALQRCSLSQQHSAWVHTWHPDVVTVQHSVMQNDDKSGFILSVTGYNIAPPAAYWRKRIRLNVDRIVVNLHGFYRDETLSGCSLRVILWQGPTYISPYWKDTQRYLK